jgi:CRISPR/Cas system-associated protein Cas10 (large subunit of type III CRISPR-Cas system)
VAKPTKFKDFIEEELENEALDMTQRLARGRQFKRNKAKIALGRKRAANRTANMDTLKKRAKKAARTTILKKLTKGIDKSDLSLARRRDLENRLDKKKNVIDKMARKLIPSVRQKDRDRKRGSKSD